MWSQSATAIALAGCFLACGQRGGGTSQVSASSPPLEPSAPDLTLHDVAFARLSEGRLAARGTARELAYRRGGGRLAADSVAATLVPDPATGYAMFGAARVNALRVDGEVGSRRGTASGGVFFRTARGDEGETERIDYDGPADKLRTDRPVDVRGPGYAVHARGLSARADGRDVTLTGGVAGTLQGDRR